MISFKFITKVLVAYSIPLFYWYTLYCPFAAGVESAGSSSSCSSSGANPKSLSEMVRVKSFNYKSMTLAYGPSYDAFVIIRYNAEKKAFTLSFGKFVFFLHKYICIFTWWSLVSRIFIK